MLERRPRSLKARPLGGVRSLVDRMWVTQVWCKSSVHLLEVCFVIQGELSFLRRCCRGGLAWRRFLGCAPEKGKKKIKRARRCKLHRNAYQRMGDDDKRGDMLRSYVCVRQGRFFFVFSLLTSSPGDFITAHSSMFVSLPVDVL